MTEVNQLAAITLEVSGVSTSLQFALIATMLFTVAYVRPNTVRDYDGRKLPKNPTARAILACFYVAVFGMMVLGFLYFGSRIQPVMEDTAAFGSVFRALHNQAPILAIVTLLLLWQITAFRGLEQHLVVTLHNGRHLKDDGDLLAHHLAHCDFQPSTIERACNRAELRKFGVFLKEDDGFDYEMVTVSNWRKVASLLRTLKAWNSKNGNRLSIDDSKQLNDIETAHERKTQLAMTIVKMLEKVAEGKDSGASLSQVMRQLSSAPQLDRAGVASAEAMAETILDSNAGNLSREAVRLSAFELRNYLEKIEHYFQTEYEILLDQVSHLVAKSVAFAGDNAPQRLEEIKAIGFPGLGHIERINFDRILWLFLIGLVGSFLAMFVGNFSQTGTGANQIPIYMMGRFAFSMAIAGLIGAIIGSNRNNASALTAPWAVYVGASVFSALLFIAIAVASNYLMFTVLAMPLPEVTTAPAGPESSV